MKKKQITQSDDLIAQGVAKKLIRIGDGGKRIEYLRHGISRDWAKPEAIIEAKAYLTLVLQYEYPDDRIQLFAPVTVGSSLREADIEVFADGENLLNSRIYDFANYYRQGVGFMLGVKMNF